MKSKPSLKEKLLVNGIAAALFVGTLGLFAAPALIGYMLWPEQGYCYVTTDMDIVGDCF